MMKQVIRAGVSLLVVVSLAACGGGGGAEGAHESPASPSAANYWTLDSHRYVDGGHSSKSTSTSTGVAVTTVVVSTATTSGGDASNGAYSGSSLSFVFKGSPVDGIYTLVPSQDAFIAADVATSPMLLNANVGVAVTTGSTQYTAASGTVRVTQDGSGQYHFSTVNSVPAIKTLDVLGGVVGAPNTMNLTIVDAY